LFAILWIGKHLISKLKADCNKIVQKIVS
jgi:hypothetical protein